MAALQTALAFVMFTLADPGSPAAGRAPEWLQQLRAVVLRNKVAAVWLLQTLLTDRTLLRSMLLRHRDLHTREAFGELVVSAIQLLVSPSSPDASAAADETFDSEVDVPPALKRRSSSVGTEDDAGVGAGAGAGAARGSGAGDDDLDQASGPSIAAHGLDGGLAFAAPPRRVVATLLKVMLEEICKAQEHVFTYAEFFDVIWHACAASQDAAAFLIREGAVGMLVDFVCQGVTPHPELVDGPGGWATSPSIDDGPDSGAGAGAAAAGGAGAGALDTSGAAAAEHAGKPRRPRFSAKVQYYAVPAVTVLEQLVRCSAGVSDAREGRGLPVLSRVDKEQLTCPAFFPVLLGCMVSASSVEKLEGLMGELLGDPASMREFVKGQIEGLKVAQAPRGVQQRIRSVRTAMQPVGDETLASTRDRVDDVMHRILEVLQGSSKYYADTVEGLNALLDLIKSVPLAGEWAVGHPEAFAWAVKWAKSSYVPVSNVYNAVL